MYSSLLWIINEWICEFTSWLKLIKVIWTLSNNLESRLCYMSKLIPSVIQGQNHLQDDVHKATSLLELVCLPFHPQNSVYDLEIYWLYLQMTKHWNYDNFEIHSISTHGTLNWNCVEFFGTVSIYLGSGSTKQQFSLHYIAIASIRPWRIQNFMNSHSQNLCLCNCQSEYN